MAKSDVIRALIDRAGPIETGEDLQRWVEESVGKGGENDAWLVATAESLDADVVGVDRSAFERLGERYLRFR